MQPLFPGDVDRAMRARNRSGFAISRRTRLHLVMGCSAVAAPFAGGSPVGSEVLDWCWAAGLAALVAYFATTAKRGSLILAGIVALAAARTAPALAFGVLSVVASGYSTRHLRRRSVFSRGLGGSAAVISLLAADGELGPWYLAAAWIAVLALITTTGWARIRSAQKRRLIWAGIAAIGFAVVASAAAAIGVAGQASLVDAGTAELRVGLEAARQGEAAVAAEHLDLAERGLALAETKISRWGALARAVPIVGQHVGAVTTVLSDVSTAASQARQTASLVDDGQLTIKAGRIDLDVVGSLAAPLRRLSISLGDVVRHVDSYESAPLLPALRDRLDELRTEAVRAGEDARTGAQAAGVMPQALGGNGETRYLVMFTSPAESRGRFGFPGSFAEVRFDRGRFFLGEHGSVSELFSSREQSYDQAAFDAGDPQIRPYSPFGVTRELQATTIAPDFPTVAKLAAEMWEQSGRAPVDGVLRFDPASLAPLLLFTGNVDVEGLDAPLTSRNVEQFLLRDQYLQFPDDQAPRRELLETVADVTFERLEVVDLPAPRVLFDLFRPLVETDHLQAVTFDPAGARLLRGIGMDGRFAPPRNDGLMVTTTNGLGNKIDSLLTTDISYTGKVLGNTVDGEVQVVLGNEAPSSGLPDYVIGSFARPEPPRGTNRTTVFVFTGAPGGEVTIDGQPVQSVGTRTGDWWLQVIEVEIPPGASRTIRVRVHGDLAPGLYRLDLVPGGPTRPATQRVDLDVNGVPVAFEGRPDSRTVVQ